MNNLMKSLLYFSTILLIGIASAQQPFINSIDKTSGTANEVVTISGAGFTGSGIQPLNGTGTEVYFGNGKSIEVNVVNSRLIKAKVPANATYGSVKVINSNNFATTSSQLFVLSFDKDDAGNNFDIPSSIETISTGQQLSWDLCMCDFDGDGLNDVVVTNDDAPAITTPSTALSVYRNTSTPIAASFASESSNFYTDPNTTHNIECGDLNGDGLPDIVFTSHDSGQPFIHVYENTSSVGSISFLKRHRLILPDLDGGAKRLPKNVRIVDVDLDGKLDLVVGSESQGDNNFFVFRNNFTGNVSFDTTPITISIPGILQTGSIYPGDFDNDGKQDLAIIATQASTAIFLLRNTSLPGNISFDFIGTISSPQSRTRIAVADFNLDGKADIATTRFAGSDGGSLEIFQNAGGFSFTPLAQISSSSFSPWGLDVGDMNGDGFPDVVIGSLTNEIVYYENNGSTGAISLATGQAENTLNARNIRIGDLNNDGKPDIGFVNNSRLGQIGQFSYVINDLCMTPVITPASGKYCNGSDFILTATAGQGVTYSWTVVGDTPSPVSTGTINQFNLSPYDQNITVTVTATSPDGCAIGSSSRSITVGSASQGLPTITDPGVVCLGDPLTLSSPNTGLASYHWKGPNGFDMTTNVPTVNVAATTTSIHAGVYTLIVNDGDCSSPEQSLSVTISAPPITSISVSSCTSGSVTLGVPNLSGQGISYQWKRDGGNIGSNSPTFVATVPGEYTVTLTDGNGCDFESDGYDLFNTSFTGPSFAAPNEICVDVASTYTANQPSLQNTWEIEDPVGSLVSTVIGTTLDYTFTTTGNKKIRLITKDVTGVGCFEKTITVSPEPAYTADISGNANKCPSAEVTLSFSEADITNVVWDDVDATVGSLTTSEPGTYTPTYTTDTGCEIVGDPVVITNLPGLNLTSSDPAIVDGVLEMNDGQTSVNLAVDASVLNPVWDITSGIGTISGSGSQISVLTGSPSLVVTVSGQTADGCNETESVTIIAESFIAKKSFSPNGDGTNDCWEIINSSILEGCTVYILDSRGANVLKTQSPFTDDCIWDGTFNGKDVPEGVYYFVMKCSDNSENQSGSILLAR
jgi:gliding motility-associated-like protein